jgi:predicted permease
LARWGSEIARPIPWSRLVLQPLVVAPLVGLALRWLPSPVFAVLDLVLAPVGASAPPVALAVLGMYLFTERRRVLGIDAADGVPIFAKLVVVPAATLAWGWALGIGGDRLVTWVVLAAVPAGITTFSLARDLGVAEDRVARAILTTSALAVVTMPGWAMLARAVGSMP